MIVTRCWSWVEYDEEGERYLRQCLKELGDNGPASALAHRLAEGGDPTLAASFGCRKIALDAFEYKTLGDAMEAEQARRAAPRPPGAAMLRDQLAT